jgi:5-methylcytosine-specific restriction endonuclease McrA
MPANHRKPHTDEAKRKISQAHRGVPRPHKRRPFIEVNGDTHWRCGACGEYFPRTGFHAEKRTILGIKTTCKKCHNACNVASRDKDNKRKKAVIYEAARRARKAGGEGVVNDGDWQRLVEILGNACLKCGSLDKITQDHVVPLSKGGQHHPTNLQPLCRTCNEIKQARIADYRTDAQRRLIESVWAIEFKCIEPCL